MRLAGPGGQDNDASAADNVAEWVVSGAAMDSVAPGVAFVVPH
jgi:hypothetical protein